MARFVFSNNEEKANPKNAILLCNLHDGLFDKGYISLSDAYEVIFRDKTDLEKQSIKTDLLFRNPKNGEPETEFLKFHRKKFNLGE